MTSSKIDQEAKSQLLIWAAKRCFETGLQTNAGGNLSIRLESREAILIKPSGIGFNECTPDNLQIAHMNGDVDPSPYKPSKDLDFHLAIYRTRPDVNAIVHCHSPWATGYASAGREIPCLTVQTIEKLGRMPLIPLSKNGGPQTNVEISPVFEEKSVKSAVLANHGTIAVGADMREAQYLAEIIEETAHIAFVRDVLSSATTSQSNSPMPKYGTAASAQANE